MCLICMHSAVTWCLVCRKEFLVSIESFPPRSQPPEPELCLAVDCFSDVALHLVQATAG